MKVFTQKINCATNAQADFVDITDFVRDVVQQSGVKNGQVLVYAAHTTMGVMINHNEPMLLKDLTRVLSRIAPTSDQYAHDMFELRRSNKADGRSNGHSHCKAAIVGTSECVPIADGKMLLSGIQSILAVDLDGPRTRDVLVQVMGL